MLSVIQRNTLATRCLGSAWRSGYTPDRGINIGQVHANIYRYSTHLRHCCVCFRLSACLSIHVSIYLNSGGINIWHDSVFSLVWIACLARISNISVLRPLQETKGSADLERKVKYIQQTSARVFFWGPGGIWGGGWGVGKGEPGAGPSAVRLFVVWAVWTSQRLTAPLLPLGEPVWGNYTTE